MKQIQITFILTVLISMAGIKTFAYDIEAKNDDGVTIYYTYINNNTELAVSYSNKYSGNVIIPESVTDNGKTYSVTSIGKEAFRGCTSLTSVTIPNSVTTLGYYSGFDGCSNLKTIILGDHLNKIHDFTFKNCKSLEDVYCYARTIKETGTASFYNASIEWCTLHVPESSITLYSKNKPWSEFGNIVALTADDPKPTGVIGVRPDNEATITDYFSPDGQRLDAPRKGVNIVKMSDGTVKKVVIK